MGEIKRLVPLTEAQKLIDVLKARYYYERGAEEIDVFEGINRELYEDIVSANRSPPHDFASYDGYAMKAGDCDSYPLKIVHSIYAGDEKSKLPVLKRGEAMAIATGAFLPEGADTVLRLEDARVENDLLYGIPITPGTKVVKAGSNFEKGDVILKRGQRLRPQDIGILHEMGVTKIKVFRKIRVAVFSTGDEIHKGLLRDSNGPVTMAFLKEWGCEPVFIGTVPDDLELTKEKFIEGTANYDAVITSGGVSVGDRDYVLKAILDLGTLLMHKVKTRPGKPLAIGIINDKPVFGLPGKPTGAFIAAELNLRRYFYGPNPRATVKSKISEDINLSTKDTDSPDIANIVFVLRQNGMVFPMGFKDSPMKLISSGGLYNVSTIASSLRAAIADGYVIVDRNIKKGEIVEVNLF